MQDVRMITKGKALVVIDAGSSTLGWSLYDASTPALALIARGQFTHLGTAPQFHAADDQGTTLAEETIDSAGHRFGHSEAFEHLARWLQFCYGGQLNIVAIGHRIAHGGDDFFEPTLIDAEAMEYLQGLVQLASHHQADNLAGVRAVTRLRPDLLQIACFDTSFHHSRAPITERFAVSEDLFSRGIKRWGFHGLACESIVGQLSRTSPHLASGRVIVAHLGEESSICGIKAGRSIDTTAGFSALDGLPGAKHCGTLDSGAILHLMQTMPPNEIETLLCERSGLSGISGVDGDIRTLLSTSDPLGTANVEFFVYRVIREIGSMAGALGGLDALIFTSEIGEHCPDIRGRICGGLSWLGIEVDVRANERHEQCISPTGRSPSAWVIPTDIDGVIAAHTARLVALVPQRITQRGTARDDGAHVGQPHDITNEKIAGP
ncbi:MAG TPA: acetate kinase [Phycisphaerae bacterium]|nr:acetate kinase [Phycisphaerae bacterium]